MVPDEDPCYLLNCASRLLKCRTNEKLAEIGLTFPQFLLLMDILKSAQDESEPCSPAAIAEHANYERATVTGILDRLERDGFILRQTNPADRRSYRIVPTEKAQSLADTMDGYFELTMNLALEGIAVEDQEILKRYLKQIIHNLEK